MQLTDGSTIWYSIEGVNPEPWEAPQGTPLRNKKTGKLFVQARSTARHRNLLETIKEEFPRQNPGYFSFGSVPLEIEFFLWREVPEYVNDKGKLVTGQHVDATNCQKAIEDGLQGILYTNDTTNRRVSTEFIQQAVAVSPFILVGVTPYSGERHDRSNALRERLTTPTFTDSNELNDGRADIF